MEQRPIAQGTGTGNKVLTVYPDRVVLSPGFQGQNTSVGLKQVANVSIRGWVNCTLTIEINDGRRLNVERMALPDARQIKAAIERQKRIAGLHE